MRRSNSIPLGIAALVPMVLACSSGAASQGGDMGVAQAAPGTEQMLTGRVYLTGSEPVTTVALQVEGQSSVRLVGDLSGELRRLSGATVQVRGIRRRSAPMDNLDASSYTVISIDGQEPMVGWLGAHEGGFHLYVGSDSIPLTSVPSGMRRPGAKVWVVGRRMGGSMSVQSFGIIREP